MDDDLKKLICDRESYIQEIKRIYLHVHAFLEIIHNIEMKLEPKLSSYFDNYASEGASREYLKLKELSLEIRKNMSHKTENERLINLTYALFRNK